MFFSYQCSFSCMGKVCIIRTIFSRPEKKRMCITLEKAGFLRGREECIVDIVLLELRHEKRFYSIRLGVNCKDSVELAHTSILHLIVQTLVHSISRTSGLERWL